MSQRAFLSFIVTFFVISISCETLIAYEYPKAKKDEIIVLALNEEQMASLCNIENYSIAGSPGVCYGIDRVNYAFLTRIKFQLGIRDSDEDIENKLIQAALYGIQETIYGFESGASFTSQMEANWDLDTNPLRRAIEKVQIRQRKSFLKTYLKKKALQLREKGEYLYSEETVAFAKLILNGVPIFIVVGNQLGFHALTVVGFKVNFSRLDSITIEFLVLDSNYPDSLQILSLKKMGEVPYWSYSYLNRFSWEEKFYSESFSNFLRTLDAVVVLWDVPQESEIKLAQSVFDPVFLTAWGGRKSFESAVKTVLAKNYEEYYSYKNFLEIQLK